MSALTVTSRRTRGRWIRCHLASLAVASLNMFLGHAPPALADQNVVVFISDVDAELEANDKKWLRTSGQFERYRIVDPDDLVDLALILQETGKREKIDYLFIMGHGNENGIQFRKEYDPWLTEEDFVLIKQHIPGLPEAFSEYATVEFFNCGIGSNRSFLRTAGEAFLGLRGGQVLATEQDISGDAHVQLYPASHVTVDIPKRQTGGRASEVCDRNSPRYNATTCEWLKNIREGLERSGTGTIQRIE